MNMMPKKIKKIFNSEPDLNPNNISILTIDYFKNNSLISRFFAPTLRKFANKFSSNLK